MAGAALRHLLRNRRAAVHPGAFRRPRMASPRTRQSPTEEEAFQAAVGEAERFLQVEMFFV